MKALWQTVIMLAISACSFEPANFDNLFFYENFVGEGRPEYKATTDQIELRGSPNSGSSITSTESISGEQTLPFDEAITRTVNPGQTRILGDVSIQIRNFGEIEKLTRESYYDESIAWVEKTIKANDDPTILMWMAEGTCLIKIGQTVGETNECPKESDKHWILLSQPETESWIRVAISNSKGWLRVDDQRIKEVNRNF